MADYIDAMICFFQGVGDQRWVSKNTPKTPQFHTNSALPAFYWKNAPEICHKCAGLCLPTTGWNLSYNTKNHFPSLPPKKFGGRLWISRIFDYSTHPITELACSWSIQKKVSCKQQIFCWPSFFQQVHVMSFADLSAFFKNHNHRGDLPTCLRQPLLWEDQSYHHHY